MSEPASISIQRRIEWIDTDAAGIYHWTTACRLTEAAEAELHRALGISDLTFGVSPRLSVQLDFKQRLRFDDLVTVTFTVDKVGRSSITYNVEILGPEGLAVTGTMVTCIVESEEGRAIPLPAQIRRALTESGTVEAG